MPALDIDDAISLAATNIADVSYLQPASSLFVQSGVWLLNIFVAPASIFPPSVESVAGKRTVRDWLVSTQNAISAIEGPGNTDSGVVGTAAMIEAVLRVLYAVKYANINGYITQLEEDATVALFNIAWP